LKEIFAVLGYRKWLILIVLAMVVGTALGVSLVQTPVYQASAKMLVGQEPGNTINAASVADLQQLTQTVVEATNSDVIAEKVIEQLDLSMTTREFREHLTVRQLRGTQLMEISYADTNPRYAQQVANTTGEAISEQISQSTPSANPITVTVWDQAQLPNSPISPNLVVNSILAIIIGLALGVGLAFALEYLEGTWPAPAQVEQRNY
jgi:capsular polysaccharide biosynthesis protein